MALLTTPQGRGGGRIPMGDGSYVVSRRDLTALIDAMPTAASRAMHRAAREGDTATAQRLLREAAATYFTSAPAAPAAPPPMLRRDSRSSTPMRNDW